ncbi:MAG: acetolactate synthase small subunit [Leptospiraceae bacterium]|nr:acetolactate synthase small subunit [Leptospiraceae bacterium]
MRHTLNILVNNHPGVMSHVSGLFTRRGYNIDSIAVGVTDDPEISCMTIVVRGDDDVVLQVQKQLLKLPDVLQVKDLHYSESITRELVLLQINSTDATRTEIVSVCDVFKAKIVDVTENSVIIEYSGNTRQVEALIKMIKKFGILDMARTGTIALEVQSTKE